MVYLILGILNFSLPLLQNKPTKCALIVKLTIIVQYMYTTSYVFRTSLAHHQGVHSSIKQSLDLIHIYHHHVLEGLGVFPVP